ncbi:hypothetical protein RB12557 [Rhodopirellula baltica SH 1]|uniref:Uncharacterized protein n=1 Tax=Rhodopirellula baltica (strain DSM 10527 / NCIMB 13988 / SH1) TaxID=243090 RepID=Q7UIG0_RHOBA|nr:hypothetical protein RB12557 [Rhodopirellula baltica SH 1]
MQPHHSLDQNPTTKHSHIALLQSAWPSNEHIGYKIPRTQSP